MQQQIILLSAFLRRTAAFVQAGLMLAVLTALVCAASAFTPRPAESQGNWSGSLSDTTATTICAGENFIFGGDTLTISGVYSDTLIAGDGSDSIVVLDLTVLPLSTTMPCAITHGTRGQTTHFR